MTSVRARARGGGEGRRAVGGRDRKTRVDCPCALGWLLERWHSDAYLRLPGVPFFRRVPLSFAKTRPGFPFEGKNSLAIVARFFTFFLDI